MVSPTDPSYIIFMLDKTLTVSFVGNPPYVYPDETGVDINYAKTVGEMLGFNTSFFFENSR